MAKIRYFAFGLSICLLVACVPSAQAIQTAMAETQAALPTPTQESTPTPLSCNAQSVDYIAKVQPLVDSFNDAKIVAKKSKNCSQPPS